MLAPDIDHRIIEVAPGKPITVDSLSTPIYFRKLEEGPHTIKYADLFAILSYYHAITSKNSPGTPQPESDKKSATASEPKIITTIVKTYPEVLKAIALQGVPTKTVFRCWPYVANPCDTFAVDRTIRGKRTPNGAAWGASVFDFYLIRYVPKARNVATSGSKLLEWAEKREEEMVYAKDEIEWARREGDPCVIEPCAIGVYVAEQEGNIRARKDGWGVSIPMDWDLLSTIVRPEKSLFHPSNYQSPWPLVPFSYPTERLHTRIPLYQLPKKIMVHDPWNLLAVEDYNCYGEARTSRFHDVGIPWVDMPDKVHTYKLQLTRAGKARLESELLEAESESRVEGQDTKEGEEDDVCIIKDLAESLHGYLLHSYSDTPPGPICPPIFVVHDPPPSPFPTNPTATGTAAKAREQTQPIPEAHLYLSPAHRVGQGHHSVVYHGEWELPRTVLSPAPLPNPVLCKPCVEADVARILAEEDGKDGERRLGKWDEKCSVLRKVDEIVKPSVGVRFACQEPTGGDDHSASGTMEVGEQVYVVDPETRRCKIELEGPIRPIKTTVKWQDPHKPTCAHLHSLLPVPPTAKVGVVAKMSIRHDMHLEREAENYQEFERHLSEHWSGWNFLLKTQKLVPVSPVVPQFYGYYVPEWEEEDDDDDDDEEDDGGSQVKSVDNRGEEVKSPPKHGYFSPILLLENCGTEITHCELTDGDKDEIASLVHRFNLAGWAHQSIYHRNILVQRGPLNVPHAEQDKRNFRLIDFGRSVKCRTSGATRSFGMYSESWERRRKLDEEMMAKVFRGF